MRIMVQFYGSIRAAAALPEEEIWLQSDGSLSDALEKLKAGHSDTFRGEVFGADHSTIRDDLTLTVNGVIIDHAKASETPLQAGSVVALLPVFPGGG